MLLIYFYSVIIIMKPKNNVLNPDICLPILKLGIKFIPMFWLQIMKNYTYLYNHVEFLFSIKN